jgi:hypothetical protein
VTAGRGGSSFADRWPTAPAGRTPRSVNLLPMHSSSTHGILVGEATPTARHPASTKVKVMVTDDNGEVCEIHLRCGHVHLPLPRRRAWYSAHAYAGSGQEHWSVGRTAERWVPAWPAALLRSWLRRDLAMLLADLEAAGWRPVTGGDTGAMRFWRPVTQPVSG